MTTPMNHRDILKQSRKIVIKLGTNVLSNEDGTLNDSFLFALAKRIASVVDDGKQVVLVTSGARIAGVAALGKWRRKEDIHYKQALCAIGQVRLMERYHAAFGAVGLLAAQLLLTAEDTDDATRKLNVRNTLFTLLDERVIPVINENDTVSVTELVNESFIGDNDNLSALVAELWSADLLLILSDIDGLYDQDPDYAKEKGVKPKLLRIADSAVIGEQVELGDKGRFGVGGMRTKIEAAQRVNRSGIPMILANGKRAESMAGLFSGEEAGTLFPPREG